MAARVDFTVPLSIVGVLAAIGAGAWHRGETLVGGGCLAGAMVVLGWVAAVVLKSRRR